MTRSVVVIAIGAMLVAFGLTGLVWWQTNARLSAIERGGASDALSPYQGGRGAAM